MRRFLGIAKHRIVDGSSTPESPSQEARWPSAKGHDHAPMCGTAGCCRCSSNTPWGPYHPANNGKKWPLISLALATDRWRGSLGRVAFKQIGAPGFPAAGARVKSHPCIVRPRLTKFVHVPLVPPQQCHSIIYAVLTLNRHPAPPESYIRPPDLPRDPSLLPASPGAHPCAVDIYTARLPL